MMVARDVQNLYVEYCRRRASCLTSSIVCHMCVFDRQFADHCTVVLRDVVWHCNEFHKKIAFPCLMDACDVRVGKEEEIQQHLDYCHELPRDLLRDAIPRRSKRISATIEELSKKIDS